MRLNWYERNFECVIRPEVTICCLTGMKGILNV